MKNPEKLRNLAEWSRRFDGDNGPKVADDLEAIADDYERLFIVYNEVLCSLMESDAR